MHGGTHSRSPIRRFSAVQILHDVASGSIVGSLAVAYCYTFAALIFSGPIAAGLGTGLAAAFIGTAITALIVAQWSSVHLATGGMDTPVIAVVAVIAGSIGGQMLATANDSATIATVLAAIVIATALTGLVLLVLGLLRGGAWLRFIPYSVSAGFLGASGLFLVAGALKVTTGVALALPLDVAALTPAHQAQALAAIATALLLLATRWFRSPFLMPSALFLVAILTNVVTHALEATQGAGAFADWYLSDAHTSGTPHPVWALFAAQEIDWGVIAEHGAGIFAVAGITVLAVLLNVSGLEVVRHVNANLDREFVIAGAGNLVASLFGGLPGNLSMNRSYLNMRSGALTRASGYIVSLICLVFLFEGNALAPFVPRFVLGGLLIFLGISVLSESVLRPPKHLSRADRLLAIIIMVVVVKFGYAAATAFGVICACAIFAVNCARIDVIKQKLTRKTYPSKVTRGPVHTALLLERGDSIQILRLHGYLFFGTAHRLLTQIQDLTASAQTHPVRFVILDLGMVPDFDSSAVLSLGKMRRFCESAHVELLFCNVTRAMAARLNETVLAGQPGDMPRVFTDRDDAIEWCEEHILAAQGGDELEPHFLDWLSEEIGGETQVARLLAYLDRREYPRGEILYRQGDAADTIDFVESGRLRIEIEQADGRALHVRSMTDNTVVGEMGFYRDMLRTASVVAERPTVVYRLDRQRFMDMFEQDPQTNSRLNALIVRILSDRLAGANQELAAFS